MKTIVVIYNKMAPDTFLSQTVFLDSIHQMRIGAETYRQELEALEPLKGADWIYAAAARPLDENMLLQHTCRLIKKKMPYCEPTDRIIIFDASFYPVDKKWFGHLLSKIMATNLPANLYFLASSGNILVLTSLQYRYLGAETKGELEKAEIIAGPGQLGNLSDTSTVLWLFSGGFSLRHFNNIQPGRQGFFLKRSADQVKMKAEYSFYTSLPSGMRPYFPQVGDYIETKDGAGYEIEIVPMLDAAKSFLNGVFARKQHCRCLMAALESYFKASPSLKVSVQEHRRQLRELFVEKTVHRLEMLHRLDRVKKLDDLCRLNGFESLNDFARLYMDKVEQELAGVQDDMLFFSHGDLFFSNILFDPVKETIKLIDPKGSDGPTASYRPLLYDLAKLSHSFLGDYDLMVYNLVDVVVQPGIALGLRSHAPAGAEFLRELFKEFLRKMNVSAERVRLYEGTLFISMLPLHSDEPLRMCRQLVQAMNIYDMLFRKN